MIFAERLASFDLPSAELCGAPEPAGSKEGCEEGQIAFQAKPCTPYLHGDAAGRSRPSPLVSWQPAILAMGAFSPCLTGLPTWMVSTTSSAPAVANASHWSCLLSGV